jgi:hypothetical protein
MNDQHYIERIVERTIVVRELPQPTVSHPQQAEITPKEVWQAVVCTAILVASAFCIAAPLVAAKRWFERQPPDAKEAAKQQLQELRQVGWQLEERLRQAMPQDPPLDLAKVRARGRYRQKDIEQLRQLRLQQEAQIQR